MKKILLGKTGYDVSAVVYGGVISMQETQAASDRYISYAMDQGINYFDVAPSYGDAEEKMGNSLKPYRKGVYLACKTEERLRNKAQNEIEKSLRLLRTDWFDLFQLHAVTTPFDVESAFGPGGVMELLIDLKQEGIIRKLGFSAHSERAALECLRLYPFDTVMFPMNWMLHLGQDIGTKLCKVKAEQDFGLIGIKSLAERVWTEQDDREGTYPKSWCKPFDRSKDGLGLAAMRYSVSVLHADVLIPPGNFGSLRFMAEHSDEAISKPISPDELALLNNHYTKVKDLAFFDKNKGNWADQ